MDIRFKLCIRQMFLLRKTVLATNMWLFSVRSDTASLMWYKTVNVMDIRKHYTYGHTHLHPCLKKSCAYVSVKRVHMYLQSLPVGKSNIVVLVCLLVLISELMLWHSITNRWICVGNVMHNLYICGYNIHCVIPVFLWLDFFMLSRVKPINRDLFWLYVEVRMYFF